MCTHINMWASTLSTHNYNLPYIYLLNTSQTSIPVLVTTTAWVQVPKASHQHSYNSNGPGLLTLHLTKVLSVLFFATKLGNVVSFIDFTLFSVSPVPYYRCESKLFRTAYKTLLSSCPVSFFCSHAFCTLVTLSTGLGSFWNIPHTLPPNPNCGHIFPSVQNYLPPYVEYTFLPSFLILHYEGLH